jgi:hypothetical protein
MPYPKMMLAKPLLSEKRYQSKGRYTMAYLSGVLKRIEANLASGSYWEYFIPPVVIPGMIITVVVIVAVYRWW